MPRAPHLDINEKNFVERFRSGDEQAFRDLYDELSQRVYRFALRITASAEDAEDVAVQTFTQVFSARASFRGDARIETWVLRIATHMANRISRSRRKATTVMADMPDNQAGVGFAEIELLSALGNLRADQRLAITLVRLEHLSYREAAAVMKRPIGTVQTLVFQGSKALRSQLLENGASASVEATEKYSYEV